MAIIFPQTTLPDIQSIIGQRSIQSPETLAFGMKALAGLAETYITLIAGGASGGAAQSFYTDATTYQNLNPSEFQINPDNYPGAKFYLEAVCRAGAYGDPVRTFYLDLYSINNNASVTGSEISTQLTEGQASPGSLPLITGGTDFKPNLPAGTGGYVLRYKSDTSGRFVDLYYARLLIIYS